MSLKKVFPRVLIVFGLVGMFTTNAMACSGPHNTDPRLMLFNQSLLDMSLCGINQHISDDQGSQWFESIASRADTETADLYEHFLHFVVTDMHEVSQNPELLEQWTPAYCEQELAQVSRPQVKRLG
ncbi:hypothetical protein [Vibrio superstes]|uniref:Uncharacterized protein n=1 Tax=Vibrio superstes NBRC 103154 TaxID=1219062 RepID=A0A511QY16_9VIBR|nr:hypothetical protein [Vibrio superstes]GEM81432.1 hypothetical protein VSU01S_36770 [Vibrio superstes NBRC 103154]